MWHGTPINELIAGIPLSDEKSLGLDPQGEYVNFIETFTIYFGQDEVNEFFRFVIEQGFVSALRPQGNLGMAPELKVPLIRALKQAFVFNRVFVGLGGEDMVNCNGLPYLDEAKLDLECALALFRLNHPKACLQVLRSVLETMVIHIYLTIKGISYDYLQINMDRFLSVTDRQNGMLAYLVDSKFIDVIFADEITRSYRILSRAVHSQFIAIDVWLGPDFRDRANECLGHIKTVSTICTQLTLCLLRYECGQSVQPLTYV